MAEAAHTPVPAEYAPLFTRDLHEQLAEELPDELGRHMGRLLNQPLSLWLQAYDSAKVLLCILHVLGVALHQCRRMHQIPLGFCVLYRLLRFIPDLRLAQERVDELERMRLQYDAGRRKIAKVLVDPAHR